MATLTIRNLDDTVRDRLRVRAAQHGVSMEEEARRILRAAAYRDRTRQSLGQMIREAVAPVGGVDIEAPVRDDMGREPPDFSQ